MGALPQTWGYRDIAECPQGVLDYLPMVITTHAEWQSRQRQEAPDGLRGTGAPRTREG